MTSRPVLRRGDKGPDVYFLQEELNKLEVPRDDLVVDGIFGRATESAVEEYQGSRALTVDGIVGPQTWDALESQTPIIIQPPLPPQPDDDDEIIAIARDSAIAKYTWPGRGVAPKGYTNGMALSFAYVYRRFKSGDSSALEMAKADTRDDNKDALSWYRSNFQSIGMDNSKSGADTLRHLFVLMLGLGMRESSGRHCEGRDMSATNVQANTCEAGAFQQSWDSNPSTKELKKLMDEYKNPAFAKNNGYLDVYREAVSCSQKNWDCYGSPSSDGYQFQKLCKEAPNYSVQSCGVGLRNIRKHWGPVNRKEVTLRKEADDMFRQVQAYIELGDAVA